MKASKFFTYNELWHSDGALRLGIDNKPTPEHLENLVWIANNIVDKCREFVGGPLHGSFYRSAALNAKTPGASKLSFHMLGMACDISCQYYGNGTNAELFRWMAKNLDFAQIIWEFGTDQNPSWIHVTAFAPSKGVIGGRRWNDKTLDRFYYDENGVAKKKPFDLPL
jgi:hypothetical protein